MSWHFRFNRSRASGEVGKRELGGKTISTRKRQGATRIQKRTDIDIRISRSIPPKAKATPQWSTQTALHPVSSFADGMDTSILNLNNKVRANEGPCAEALCSNEHVHRSNGFNRHPACATHQVLSPTLSRLSAGKRTLHLGSAVCQRFTRRAVGQQSGFLAFSSLVWSFTRSSHCPGPLRHSCREQSNGLMICRATEKMRLFRGFL